MQQAAVALGCPGIEPLQGQIQRVGTTRDGLTSPGGDFGVGPHLLPDLVGADLPPQTRGHLMDIGFRVNLIAQFNQQGHILTRAKAGIQPKRRRDRPAIRGIILRILRKPRFQHLLCGCQLGHLCSQAEAACVCLFPYALPTRLPTFLHGQARVTARQAAMRTVPACGRRDGSQACHLGLPMVQVLQGCLQMYLSIGNWLSGVFGEWRNRYGASTRWRSKSSFARP